MVSAGDLETVVPGSIPRRGRYVGLSSSLASAVDSSGVALCRTGFIVFASFQHIRLRLG